MLWHTVTHGRGSEGETGEMECVASTTNTTLEHGVSSITTADAHTSAASSRMNWRPRHFKWTRLVRRNTNSGFCACAITFQTQSTNITSRDLQQSTDVCQNNGIQSEKIHNNFFVFCASWDPPWPMGSLRTTGSNRSLPMPVYLTTYANIFYSLRIYNPNEN